MTALTRGAPDADVSLLDRAYSVWGSDSGRIRIAYLCNRISTAVGSAQDRGGSWDILVNAAWDLHDTVSGVEPECDHEVVTAPSLTTTAGDDGGGDAGSVHPATVNSGFLAAPWMAGVRVGTGTDLDLDFPTYPGTNDVRHLLSLAHTVLVCAQWITDSVIQEDADGSAYYQLVSHALMQISCVLVALTERYRRRVRDAPRDLLPSCFNMDILPRLCTVALDMYQMCGDAGSNSDGSAVDSMYGKRVQEMQAELVEACDHTFSVPSNSTWLRMVGQCWVYSGIREESRLPEALQFAKEDWSSNSSGQLWTVLCIVRKVYPLFEARMMSMVQDDEGALGSHGSLVACLVDVMDASLKCGAHGLYSFAFGSLSFLASIPSQAPVALWDIALAQLDAIEADGNVENLVCVMRSLAVYAVLSSRTHCTPLPPEFNRSFSTRVASIMRAFVDRQSVTLPLFEEIMGAVPDSAALASELVFFVCCASVEIAVSLSQNNGSPMCISDFLDLPGEVAEISGSVCSVAACNASLLWMMRRCTLGDVEVRRLCTAGVERTLRRAAQRPVLSLPLIRVLALVTRGYFVGYSGTVAPNVGRVESVSLFFSNCEDSMGSNSGVLGAVFSWIRLCWKRPALAVLGARLVSCLCNDVGVAVHQQGLDDYVVFVELINRRFMDTLPYIYDTSDRASRDTSLGPLQEKIRDLDVRGGDAVTKSAVMEAVLLAPILPSCSALALSTWGSAPNIGSLWLDAFKWDPEAANDDEGESSMRSAGYLQFLVWFWRLLLSSRTAQSAPLDHLSLQSLLYGNANDVVDTGVLADVIETVLHENCFRDVCMAVQGEALENVGLAVLSMMYQTRTLCQDNVFTDEDCTWPNLIAGWLSLCISHPRCWILATSFLDVSSAPLCADLLVCVIRCGWRPSLAPPENGHSLEPLRRLCGSLKPVGEIALRLVIETGVSLKPNVLSSCCLWALERLQLIFSVCTSSYAEMDEDAFAHPVYLSVRDAVIEALRLFVRLVAEAHNLAPGSLESFGIVLDSWMVSLVDAARFLGDALPVLIIEFLNCAYSGPESHVTMKPQREWPIVTVDGMVLGFAVPMELDQCLELDAVLWNAATDASLCHVCVSDDFTPSYSGENGWPDEFIPATYMDDVCRKRGDVVPRRSSSTRPACRRPEFVLAAGLLITGCRGFSILTAVGSSQGVNLESTRIAARSCGAFLSGLYMALQLSWHSVFMLSRAGLPEFLLGCFSGVMCVEGSPLGRIVLCLLSKFARNGVTVSDEALSGVLSLARPRPCVLPCTLYHDAPWNGPRGDRARVSACSSSWKCGRSPHDIAASIEYGRYCGTESVNLP